jgi:pre-mRNA cleavage complex 2 protein Pcf11
MDLRAQFVVVPAGAEAKMIACPVCKEVLRAEFNEDDEEWVWRNAMDVDGRVRHLFCLSAMVEPELNYLFFVDIPRDMSC